MSAASFRYGVAGLIISVFLLALVSCGGSSNLDGVYHGITGGPISINSNRPCHTIRPPSRSKTGPLSRP